LLTIVHMLPGIYEAGRLIYKNYKSQGFRDPRREVLHSKLKYVLDILKFIKEELDKKF
jgi:uncharacterized Rmd1/YagE family protein